MNGGEPDLLLHLDPAGFREAVVSTAAMTGFGARLVEKDYFCTVLLRRLVLPDSALVFKGGTCLAKVYAEFYRLSEDLDFTIPTPLGASRGDRSKLAKGLKTLFGALPEIPGVRLEQPLKGANNSTQYTAVFGYRSVTSDREETIKFEAGLREPVLTPAILGRVNTILQTPLSGAALVPPFPVPCLSRQEAIAEKMRAALCRRDVAIRDFYDIDYLTRRASFPVDGPEFVEIVRQKIAVRGNQPPDVSPDRLNALRRQAETELPSVVRPADLLAFDLDRAFTTVAAIAGRVR